MNDAYIKFSDYLDNGYTIPDTVDVATANLIKEWFGTRFCLKENFVKFFERQLALYYPYYKQLLRIDPTVSSFDWFVEEYLESQTINNVTRQGEKNSNFTDNGDTQNTNNNTETRNLTRAGTQTGTDTTVQSGSQTNEHEDANTVEGATRNNNFVRNAPMSGEYSTLGDISPTSARHTVNGIQMEVDFPSDNIHRPEIKNPTSATDELTQNDEITHNLGKDEITYNNVTSQNTKNLADSTTDTGTVGNSGTTRIQSENTHIGTDTTEDTENSTSRTIHTGRHENVADIISRAKAVIMTSESWLFLYRKLDTCFLLTYDD